MEKEEKINKVTELETEILKLKAKLFDVLKEQDLLRIQIAHLDKTKITFLQQLETYEKDLREIDEHKDTSKET